MLCANVSSGICGQRKLILTCRPRNLIMAFTSIVCISGELIPLMTPFACAGIRVCVFCSCSKTSFSLRKKLNVRNECTSSLTSMQLSYVINKSENITTITYNLSSLAFITLSAYSADDKLMIFLYFQKTGLDISCKLSPLEKIV